MISKFPEQFVLQGLDIIPAQIALITKVMSLDEIKHLKLGEFLKNRSSTGSRIELRGIVADKELYNIQELGRLLRTRELGNFNKPIVEYNSNTADRNLKVDYNLDKIYTLTLRVFPKSYNPKNLF